MMYTFRVLRACVKVRVFQEMTQFILVIRIFLFRRKTGNPSHCIIQAGWVLGHIGTLTMDTVELTAKLTDLEKLKRLLTQENFQNYKFLKMVYNIQIQFSSFGLCPSCNKHIKH